MDKSQVLILRFKLDSGKKSSVRIKNADHSASTSDIQNLADVIVKTKAFDFDGKKSPYALESATYTTTSKEAIIPAK